MKEQTPKPISSEVRKPTPRTDKRAAMTTKIPPKTAYAERVWPQRITAIPKYIENEIPFFNVVVYDFFFVALIGIASSLTGFINWMFLVYGIGALLLRASSQRMFSSALMSLVIIPIATELQREEVADTFAVMTFFFLLIGLIVATIELKKQP